MMEPGEQRNAWSAMETFWLTATASLFPTDGPSVLAFPIFDAIKAVERAANQVESAALSAQNYFEYGAPR